MGRKQEDGRRRAGNGGREGKPGPKARQRLRDQKRAKRVAFIGMLAGVLALPPAWMALHDDRPAWLQVPWIENSPAEPSTTSGTASPTTGARPRPKGPGPGVPPTNRAGYTPPPARANPPLTTHPKRPPTSGSTSPRVSGPPADRVMHEVWRGGSEAHAHQVGQFGWARTEFRMRERYLRSVEVNVAGPSHVDFYVERHPSAGDWIRIAQRTGVEVQQNGHTKYVFSPAIAVPVGELLALQVWNPQQTTMTVYFSNEDDEPGRSAYTSCATPAGVCLHAGHDLNAIVYGWSRPS